MNIFVACVHEFLHPERRVIQNYMKGTFDMSRINSNEVVAENIDMLSADFDTFVEDEATFCLPTPENLTEGLYKSRLKDIEIIKADGVMTAVDCFHEIEDSAGKVRYIRFRYFVKGGGVKDLASDFKKYGFKNFNDAIGVEEDIEVSAKKNSTYLFIYTRRKKKKLSSLTSRPKSVPVTISVSDEDFDDFLEEDEEE